MPWIFTYGSLMNPAHFFQILKTHQQGKQAYVQGYHRIFTEPGTADIRASSNSIVHGVAYHLDARQVRELDSYEGVPVGYYTRIKVTMQAPQWYQEGFAYQKTRLTPVHQPPPTYFKLLVDGLRYYGYDDSVVQQLISWDEQPLV